MIIKQLKLGDKVKFIEDIDFPSYPKKAIMLIKMSKRMTGVEYTIRGIRTHNINGMKTKYKYGVTAPTMTWCAREELELII